MPSVVCPNHECQKTYTVAESALSKRLRCKVCGTTFRANSSTTLSSLQPSGSTAELDIVSNPMPSQIGRFKVIGEVGRGAFGTVYRARDLRLERDVAIKVPQAVLIQDPEFVERFLREGRAAARLNHPNIVPVYETAAAGSQAYIASAFIKGRPLSAAVGQLAGDYRRIAEIVRQLAEALYYAHSQGIVHRDVKPHNVMLDNQNKPHLMDFGLARFEDAVDKLTIDGTLMGTPAYMSPEQAAGSRDQVQYASDQYSLGIVLYELLCGETPFAGRPEVIVYNVLHQPIPSPEKFRKGIPRDLETICLKAVAKTQSHRYADCREFANDLQRWLSDESIYARRTNPIERLVRWCRREPTIAILASLLTVTMISGVVGTLSLARKVPRDDQSLPPVSPPVEDVTIKPLIPPPQGDTELPLIPKNDAVPADALFPQNRLTDEDPPSRTTVEEEKHDPNEYWKDVVEASDHLRKKQFEEFSTLLGKCSWMGSTWEMSYLHNSFKSAL